ncbi:MAG TPA: DNA mismatch repair endonuclease MutL, partial [Pirellulaceae bacterium]|nr:DNA mismatch repair endonuclease MutL [Pirellulaceae bacterium]
MPLIRKLSPSIVNKIAAGEVIERPASVVKELLENAVDAGATRIDVAVAQGGIELVRVVDNGHGIAADQLLLAVAPHATSKIVEADDLFRIGTLGFRGEALASIAEISRLIVRSRPNEADAGAEIVVNGGQAQPIAPCGCGTGTAIEVHNLFFNTPVRRKFLRTTQTELSHVSEAFTRVALAYPSIQFTLRHHDKLVYELPPATAWQERIAAFFGADLADALIPVESSDVEVRLSGFAAHPSQSRSHPRMQYVLLNGRAIRDRALQHALSEAYRGLILTGRYPIAFLRIEMPPAAVDVNVHPTKLEVRFQDSGRLYSQLLGTLRTKFLTIDLTTKFRPPTNFGTPAMESPDHPAAAADGESITQRRQELVAWAKGELQEQGAADSSAVLPMFAEPFTPRPPLELVRIDRPASAPVAKSRDNITEQTSSPASAPCADSAPSSLPPRPSGHSVPSMQVHNRYLIAESDEGVIVIDQHALHERVLYEQLRERVLSGTLETQRLLVPEAVDLSPAEAAAALANHDLLAKLGVEVSAFGGDTVLVTSYPAMLANFRPAEVLQDLVARLIGGGKSP